jgi:hypothetical protein
MIKAFKIFAIITALAVGAIGISAMAPLAEAGVKFN